MICLLGGFKMTMFCRQCEQAAKGQGCTISGICGKDAEVSALQDLLVYSLEGISVYAKLAQDLGLKDKAVDSFVAEGLFSTVTNVNFSSQRIAELIYKAYALKEKIKNLFLKEYEKKNGGTFSQDLPQAANFKPQNSLAGLYEQAKAAAIITSGIDKDIQSLREILLYGLKGMAAYANHASILGKSNDEVDAFFHKGLASLLDDKLGADDYIALIIEFGKVNLKCLQTLDSAHTEHFGHPEPTKVNLGVKKGPAIIVSGHDFYDLEQLLQQTKNSEINIYTHSEMLPAHSYPKLKKYKHLAGHFGSAWQNQQKEFDSLPAVILMTTNCLQQPRPSYKDRIFTTGLVAWPDIPHISAKAGKKDFSALINKAKELDGFKADTSLKEITVGFGHHTVLSLADKIIEAVKSKTVRHFFLIGGCDGAKPGRNYYTDFAQAVPKDCLILTLACGKFRFNRIDFGFIGDFPRLLDCGQCNDSYSAIKIALALAQAFNCNVNSLPLSLVLSWYEQKAVCILLTLLSLGVKNIRLGPTLPAFISENVLLVLVEKFGLKPITTVQKYLNDILSR
jgi:hydroxylamine reductase